jgi:hypothetical protein
MRLAKWHLTLLAIVAAVSPLSIAAQDTPPAIAGLWRVDAKSETGNGPREVIIRSDSSASWGRETVRWRLQRDRIWIAIGGEWEIYNFRVRGDQLTLSGGDLQKPVALRRIGPATPRPANVAIPPIPEDG